MSIRVTACFLYVLGFAWYARRNWFLSNCAVIALMAVIQHPDLPKSIFGIQGLNPWNMLFGAVLICWFATRQRLGLVWDMPSGVMLFLLAYGVTVFISVVRLMMNPSGWAGEPFSYMLSEYVINGFKWVLPGLLLFDGTRSRRHIWFALAAIFTVYLLLSVQVIRWVPFGAGANKAARYIQNEIGYNRVTLSMMLSGASWAVLASVVLFSKWKHRLLVAGAAAGIAFAQALTGGRTGYLSWLAVGLIFCLLKWRKFLPVIPVGVAVALAFVPGLKERVLQGFGENAGPIVVSNDSYEMTSGRNIAWPAVIDQIHQGPVFGFGRTAMHTTGVADMLMHRHNESFPHPHQAYLEVLLDSGVIGLVCVLPFYLIVLIRSIRLLRDPDDPLVCVVGATCCALVLALLIGAFGGQTFYPREGSVGMWAAIGLMLRVSVQRAAQPRGAVFAEDETEESDAEEVEVLRDDEE